MKRELTKEEKDLISYLEPSIRHAVWSASAKVFEGTMEYEGKKIKYPLRHPDKKDWDGKYTKQQLSKDSPSSDFYDCYCAFGTNQLHTPIAIYNIIRLLRIRGLIRVEGFKDSIT